MLKLLKLLRETSRSQRWFLGLILVVVGAIAGFVASLELPAWPAELLAPSSEGVVAVQLHSADATDPSVLLAAAEIVSQKIQDSAAQQSTIILILAAALTGLAAAANAAATSPPRATYPRRVTVNDSHGRPAKGTLLKIEDGGGGWHGYVLPKDCPADPGRWWPATCIQPARRPRPGAAPASPIRRRMRLARQLGPRIRLAVNRAGLPILLGFTLGLFGFSWFLHQLLTKFAYPTVARSFFKEWDTKIANAKPAATKDQRLRFDVLRDRTDLTLHGPRPVLAVVASVATLIAVFACWRAWQRRLSRSPSLILVQHAGQHIPGELVRWSWDGGWIGLIRSSAGRSQLDGFVPMEQITALPKPPSEPPAKPPRLNPARRPGARPPIPGARPPHPRRPSMGELPPPFPPARRSSPAG